MRVYTTDVRRHYVIPALVILTGAFFAFICLLILSIQFLAKLMIIPIMLLFGLAALTADACKNKPGHA